ncbi:MAG: DinB family protein [Planctomycetota bacterium]|jgi:hypothetical protein
MTQQPAQSKTQLLEALRSSERELLDKLGGLPADAFERERYENGWNGREILAHVASLEWTYPRLLDIPKEGTPPEATESRPKSSPPPTRGVRGGIGSYNERQVEKRAGASVADLLAEFQKNRAATIAAVEQADEALLATPIKSAGGITGPLATVIYLIAVMHVQGHVNDIVAK